MEQLFVFVVAALVAFFLVVAIVNRYRRCPSDKILVIYGTSATKGSAKCVHGGGTFVWPIFQDYAYMSLTPISIDANLTNALSRQNIRVDVPCRFTVGISTEPAYMQAAAERLLGQTPQQIQELARDILFGQLRLVIATMSIEELNSDRDKFLEAISTNVEVELKKIGLRLINVNVTDIKDESGYIEALGREAAAKAINEAKVRVAEQDKIGEIGKAEAVRETRVRTAEANAQAVKGENEAKVEIANSEAYRREPTPPSSSPRPPVPSVSAPPRPPMSSCSRRLRSSASSSPPRPKPSRSAPSPRVRPTPSSPRWKPRQRVSSRC